MDEKTKNRWMDFVPKFTPAPKPKKSRWDVENLEIKFTPVPKPVKKPKAGKKTGN